MCVSTRMSMIKKLLLFSRALPLQGATLALTLLYLSCCFSVCLWEDRPHQIWFLGRQLLFLKKKNSKFVFTQKFIRFFFFFAFLHVSCHLECSQFFYIPNFFTCRSLSCEWSDTMLSSIVVSPKNNGVFCLLFSPKESWHLTFRNVVLIPNLIPYPDPLREGFYRTPTEWFWKYKVVQWSGHKTTFVSLLSFSPPPHTLELEDVFTWVDQEDLAQRDKDRHKQ